ncbi:MAG: aminoacetone oxidase family FAD-binding enzyme, partial [Candidatus Omnitrophica bacterium]|nr:aminoacetone oxidase family FAD-binding enzyme [Candidatus Omnitrophota bacterium]
KILATGGGRSNLLNEKLDPSFYNQEARALVASVFEQFGKNEILDFFKDLGLAVVSEEGRIFPATHQASSVLGVLENEIDRLQVPRALNSEIFHITRNGNRGFALKVRNGETLYAAKVVLAGGGKSYPALGSDGSAYVLAKQFGHILIEPVPAVVPLTTKDPWCHLLQGQRIQASATPIVGDQTFPAVSGEVLFTKYGLSGTAILDVSEKISIAFHRKRVTKISVCLDLVPTFGTEELAEEFARRLDRGIPPEKILTGILPEKFSHVLHRELRRSDTKQTAEILKKKIFQITGTRGWNEAEFTAGGILTKEVKPRTLESELVKGLYFAGEILDVQGQRGGYNLGWAWSSGFVAGLTA